MQSNAIFVIFIIIAFVVQKATSRKCGEVANCDDAASSCLESKCCKCAERYFPDTFADAVNKTCGADTVISSCKSCNSQRNCLTCFDDVSCSTCDDNHDGVVVDSADTKHQYSSCVEKGNCPDGTYNDVSAHQCLPYNAMTGCKKAVGPKKEDCVQCVDEMFLKNGRQNDAKCVSCTTCKDDEQISAKCTSTSDTQCSTVSKDCSPMCKTCTTDTCTSCNDGLFLKDVKCEACSDKCVKCLSSEMCVACKPGFELFENSCRLKCKKGCVQCEGSADNCKKCTQGFHLTDDGKCVRGGGSNNGKIQRTDKSSAADKPRSAVNLMKTAIILVALFQYR